MIGSLPHHILSHAHAWTPPSGTGNADIFAALQKRHNAAPGTADATAANASAAAALGATPGAFGAAMSAAGSATGSGSGSAAAPAPSAVGGDPSSDGLSDASPLALAGPLLGRHQSTENATTGTGASATNASTLSNAHQAYRAAAHGLH
jgi:hypothetical protein